MVCNTTKSVCMNCGIEFIYAGDMYVAWKRMELKSEATYSLLRVMSEFLCKVTHMEMNNKIST